MNHVLDIDALDVRLDGRAVLRNIDVHVAPGEFVTLLGANGSGKSTLVRACMGLIPIASGSIDLFGVPISRFNQWSRIGYVPQRPSAVSGVPATVAEVALSGTLARRPVVGWARAADRRAAREALERVDMADRRHSSLAQLSGGQQQRVLIARALATGAELLILDEPTAGVDHAHTESLATLLGELVADGTTVVLVEHELGPMRPLIDRAVVMRDGSVAYAGPVDNIVPDPHARSHQHGEQPATGPMSGPAGVWP